MKCPNCEHVNDGGNFCENCGARLVQGEVATAFPSASQPGSDGAAAATSTLTAVPQPNAHVENVKNVSKMYFSFFLEVLKKPVAATRNTNREQLADEMMKEVSPVLKAFAGSSGTLASSFTGTMVKNMNMVYWIGEEDQLVYGIDTALPTPIGELTTKTTVFDHNGEFVMPE